MNYKVKIKDIQDKYRFRIFMAGYQKPPSGIPEEDLDEEVQAKLDAVVGKEDKSNKTNTINSSSTTTQYASAFGVWNAIKNFFTKPDTGIPKTDLSSDVQTSLGKADSAIQQHQDISGKEDKSNKTDTVDSSSTSTKYPSALGVWNAIKNFYTKAVGGIPKTDLASDVQTSLGKADSALQTHQDISGKEDKTNKKNYIDGTLTNTDYVGGKAINDTFDNVKARLNVLEQKGGRTYSIVRKITSNSSSGWTRADDALGLVANARIGSSEAVQNDFDNIYPWCDIKDCNVDSNGEPTHFIGESGFTRNEEVYVYIPKHWIHREKYTVEEDNTENIYEKISIYDYNAPGSIEIAPYMVGKYHTSKITVDDTEVHVSKTGLEPLNSTTKSTFRTKARAKGSKWGLLDWHIFDLQYLYLVEYADYNCETKVGAGFIYGDISTSALTETSVNRIVVSGTLPTGFYVGKTISIGTDRGNYSIARSRKITAINDYSSGGITGKEIVFDGEAVDTTTSSKIWCSPEFSGTLDSFGNYSGCLANDQKHTVIYRGIENLWGLEWQHVDGINIKDYVAYLSTDYTAYANDKFDGTYSAVGYTNATNNDSYIKEMGFDTTCASDNIKTLVGLPILTGGSSTTYVCDSYWSGTGNKIFYVGGNCNSYGSKYGLFASSCNSTSSGSNWNYGSRLLIHTSQ